MSVSYFVRYEGRADDPAAFLSYYREHHVPILERFPRIQHIVLHIPTAWKDPFPVKPDTFALIAQMVFANQEDLDSALMSEARSAAREDFAHFPRFNGTVYHHATISEEVFSG